MRERPLHRDVQVPRSTGQGLFPTILLHFLHPWRSDVRERPGEKSRLRSPTGRNPGTFEPRPMTISCITFDLDDTLWECGSVIAAAEQAFYEWLAAHYPRITARLEPVALVNHRRAFFKTRPELSHNLTELRKIWLARLAKEFDYPEDSRRARFPPFLGAAKRRNAVRRHLRRDRTAANALCRWRHHQRQCRRALHRHRTLLRLRGELGRRRRFQALAGDFRACPGARWRLGNECRTRGRRPYNRYARRQRGGHAHHLVQPGRRGVAQRAEAERRR